MINHKYKCIFIHIPRTSGTSLEKSFGYGDAPDKHYNAQDIFNKVGTKVWNSYFKFTFVRNPWDRVISLYHQPAFNKIGEKSGKSLEYFLENYSPYSWEHGITFCDYLNYGKIDFVGRFESREDDIRFVSKKIGLEITSSYHSRRTKHKHYTEYYNNGTRATVAAIYKDDIELFRYKFGE